MAHPSSYTEELAAELIGYLTGGLYIATACELAGISRQTFYNWKRRAEAGEEPFAAFMRRCNQASAKAEARLSTHIEKKAADDWRAAAWKLERRFPERYAEHKINRVQLSHELEKTLDLVREYMSEGAYNEFVRAVAIVQGMDTGAEEDAHSDTSAA